MMRFTLANASAVGNSAGNMPEGNIELDFDDEAAAAAAGGAGVGVGAAVEVMDILASRSARSTMSLSIPEIVGTGLRVGVSAG